jgi:PAT family beta-lactamase induction signal transducer AmpG
MDLLPPHERGKMNGFMWGSKLAGISLGGLVFTPVMVRYGLTVGVRLQAVFMLVIMLLPLLIRERPGEKLLPWTAGKRQAPQHASVSVPGGVVGLSALAAPLKVAKEVVRAFSWRTTALAALVALTASVCEGFHDATTPAVFTQTLDWTVASATQFTAFMTLLNLGYAAGPFLTRLQLSDSASYLVCGLVAALPILFLPFLRPDEVERRKLAEAEGAVGEPAAA